MPKVYVARVRGLATFLDRTHSWRCGLNYAAGSAGWSNKLAKTAVWRNKLAKL